MFSYRLWASFSRFHVVRVAPNSVPRRYDRDRILVARALALAERDDCTPAALLAAADGRRDVLEAALAIARRGSSMRPPVAAVVERIAGALGEMSVRGKAGVVGEEQPAGEGLNEL